MTGCCLPGRSASGRCASCARTCWPPPRPIHAKRAPEDGKGRAQPVILAFGGLTAADLGRADGAFREDDLVVDIEALAIEENQALSAPRSDASGMEREAEDETTRKTKDIAP